MAVGSEEKRLRPRMVVDAGGFSFPADLGMHDVLGACGMSETWMAKAFKAVWTFPVLRHNIMQSHCSSS